MLIDLAGKVAIVTGGGQGIGRTIADTLAAEGCVTVTADLRQDLLDDVRQTREKAGRPGAELLCDVSRRAECQAVAAATTERFGRIDILVNNAGVAGGGPVETLGEEIFDRNLAVNLKGTFLMCQAVVGAMKRQKAGRILNAASFAAIVPSLGGAAYASSKAGVVSLTRVLAGELGPYNVTVNAYAPGMIPTGMNRFASSAPERQEALLDTLTLRRWGSADDVARLICFLSSDLASYITGTLIDISGGKLATQMPWMAHGEG